MLLEATEPKILAALALQALGPATISAKRELIQALRDNHYEVRRLAYATLGNLDGVAEQLGEEFKQRGLIAEPDWRVKAAAFEALKKIGADQAVKG